MENRANKRMHSVMVLILNLAIVAAMVVLFFSYMRQYNLKLYEQNLRDIGNINQASAQIAYELSASQERKLNNVLRYTSSRNFTVEDFMKYIDDYNADTSASFQLIGSDYNGYVLSKDENGLYPPVSYGSRDYVKIQKIIDASENGTADIPFTVEFTDSYTGSRSFGRYAHIVLYNDGIQARYTLLMVFKSSDFTERIELNGGFAGMSTVLINTDGSYALRNADFKSENFFQYLYVYNDLTYDQLDEIKGWVLSNDGGSFRYLNGIGEECAFVYSDVPDTDWYCVSSVPIASFHTESPDFGFTAMLLVLLVCLMALDFFYLYKLNRNLKQSAKEANAASEAKTDFLSRMSHDIRTPINVINGMTELALMEEKTEHTTEYLKNIQASGKFLLGLVNDILDMNKVESGNMELHPRPYSHGEFITYINAVIRPLCEEKNIDFKLCGNMEGIVLNVDSLRLNQIFFNLLSNAVKFTPEGGHVTLTGNAEKLGERRVALDLSVSDDGVGMSEEFQKSMFTAFSQESRTARLNTSGTGLGLAIVKKLVDLMNGSIRVESTVGKGSTFFVHLELDTTDARQAASKHIASADILSGKNILLCEDHPLNAKIVVQMLSRYNVRVEVAENGKLGLEKFSASETGYYDAVLMDVRMPVMNGIEAARAIRALSDRSDAASVPIIALTANAYDSDVQACMDAGMNAHLAKPVEITTLCDTIWNIVSASQADSKQT